jgi:hypothetical protein
MLLADISYKILSRPDNTERNIQSDCDDPQKNFSTSPGDRSHRQPSLPGSLKIKVFGREAKARAFIDRGV